MLVIIVYLIGVFSYVVRALLAYMMVEKSSMRERERERERERKEISKNFG